NNPHAYLFRAIGNFHAGDRKQAEDDLQMAETQDEPKMRVMLARAAMQAQDGDYSKAAATCSDTLAREGDNGSARKLLALSNVHCAQYEAAIDSCQTALAQTKNPATRAQLYRIQGFAETQVGQRLNAMADLTRAIRIAPDRATFLQRGDLYCMN